MIRPLLSWASHLYLFAAILYLAYFLRANRKVARAAFAALGLGFGLHTLVIGQAFFSRGYTPAHGSAEAFSLLGWFLAGGLLAVQKAYRLPAIGAFSTPLLVAVVVPAALMHTERHLLPASLQLAGLPVHVGVAFAGIAAFALAASASVAYLLLEHQMKKKRFGVVFARLPSLQVLDEVSNRLMRWGFVALSVTLLTGAVIAKLAWGEFWRWDPKLTLSLVGWLVYTALVHARIFAGWRGRRC
ncbi:MAG: cytochrome C assembly family protein [Myxococcales bacterium]|jgi:ABC-type transport system involved in cytochrome c biogenesis permease subunit